MLINHLDAPNVSSYKCSNSDTLKKHKRIIGPKIQHSTKLHEKVQLMINHSATPTATTDLQGQVL